MAAREGVRSGMDGDFAPDVPRILELLQTISFPTDLPQHPPLSTRSARAPPSTLPCPAAARVRLVRQHPPFPRLLCSLPRPRSSFPSGDDRASCAARCSSTDGRFAGDEHPTGVWRDQVR